MDPATTGRTGPPATGKRTVTKQTETRSQVLDLIEQLGVGEAIPSERQLSSDLGVSRLTVRAALDDLVREGMLVRRHGSGTFVSEPKIAQELTMTSFTEDMQRRGMVPASRTLDLRIAPAGAHLGRLLHVSPSEPVVVIERLRLADRETMAIETLHVRESLVPGLTAADLERQSFYELLLDRYDIDIVGGHPDDRAHGHERARVRGARGAAALAGVRLRAHDALERGGDRRVRPLHLSWRPLPARHGAQPPFLAPRRRQRRQALASLVSTKRRNGVFEPWSDRRSMPHEHTDCGFGQRSRMRDMVLTTW